MNTHTSSPTFTIRTTWPSTPGAKVGEKTSLRALSWSSQSSNTSSGVGVITVESSKTAVVDGGFATRAPGTLSASTVRKEEPEGTRKPLLSAWSIDEPSADCAATTPVSCAPAALAPGLRTTLPASTPTSLPPSEDCPSKRKATPAPDVCPGRPITTCASPALQDTVQHVQVLLRGAVGYEVGLTPDFTVGLPF